MLQDQERKVIKRRSRRRGKRNQRVIAKLLSGDNRGIIGKEDVRVDSRYYIECKERESLPKSLQHMWDQAVYNTPEGKIPVVQLHILGTEYLKSDLVFMLLKDFKDIIEKERNETYRE